MIRKENLLIVILLEKYSRFPRRDFRDLIFGIVCWLANYKTSTPYLNKDEGIVHASLKNEDLHA